MKVATPYDTGRKPTWCPGCGNFGILRAVKQALSELRLEPEKVVVVTGIGCSGRMADYLNVHSFHATHGRVLPLATGIKLANHELVVVGFAGDGDAYSIGVGHLPHAARRNVDLTYVVHNNMVFGLTTGQFSPTSPRGFVSKTSPSGTVEEPLNPIAFALACGATFVARGYVGELKHLVWLMKEAITHKGFALLDVLQPCVTFNPQFGYKFYSERVYKLEDEGHDPSDFEAAMRRALEWGEKIPIGIFYKVRRPTFEEALPQLAAGPLVKAQLRVNIADLIERFA